jgi:transcriptional regulator with XRE-family HTH domain
MKAHAVRITPVTQQAESVPANRPDSFGSILRRKRQESGLSQARLAFLVNLTPSTVTRLESGQFRPSVVTITALASVLNCPPGELFGSGFGPEPGSGRRVSA